VARKKGFLAAEFSNRFQESYAALSHDRQKAVDMVVLALMKQDVTLGLRVKPIQPEKYYREARINDGDRLVYRIDEGKLWVIDVVSHDDIVRYGKKVKGS
jgi:Txe/YoeB family toxin of Txe-Axe toxin-antitoxin module